MPDPIEWVEEKRTLAELRPWGRNPRQITEKQAQRLADSVQRFGQVETLAIGPDNELYNGHQRLAVLADEYGPSYKVDVRVASRPLSEREREQLTVYLHRGATGEWDFDTLANEFEVEDLLEWGFSPSELGMPGDQDAKTEYTEKIVSPLYEPKREKPDIHELYNSTPANNLLHDIEQANIDEDTKEFLRLAALRHTVFNFQNIAEFYAHSDAQVQKLMEDSALVIIDFDRAIELGYVKLSQGIQEIVNFTE